MKLNHSYVYRTVLRVNNYPYLITGYLITKIEWKRFFFCLLACMSNNRINSPEVNIIHFLPARAVSLKYQYFFRPISVHVSISCITGTVTKKQAGKYTINNLARDICVYTCHLKIYGKLFFSFLL